MPTPPMCSRATAVVKPEGEREKEKLVQTTEREKNCEFEGEEAKNNAEHQSDISPTHGIDDLVEKKR